MEVQQFDELDRRLGSQEDRRTAGRRRRRAFRRSPLARRLDQSRKLEAVERAGGVAGEAGARIGAASHFDHDGTGAFASREFPVVGDGGLANGPFDDRRFVVPERFSQQPPGRLGVQAFEGRVGEGGRRSFRLVALGQQGERLGGRRPGSRESEAHRTVELAAAYAARAVDSRASPLPHPQGDLTGAPPVAVEVGNTVAGAAAPALQPEDFRFVRRRAVQRGAEFLPDPAQGAQAGLGLGTSRSPPS